MQAVELVPHPVVAAARIWRRMSYSSGLAWSADLVLGENGVEDVLLQRTAGGQAGAQLGQKRRVLPVGDQRGAHHAGGLQRVGHGQKGLGGEGRAHAARA